MDAQTLIHEYTQHEYCVSDVIKAQLHNENLRDTIYSLIPQHDVVSFHTLLQAMFEEEVHYRNDDKNDGVFFENIYLCAFLLYTIGDVEDIMPMWRAKQSNFDVGCGFDIQFLVGAGIHETIEYLKRLNTEASLRAMAYIETCRSAGDFDNIQEWIEGRKSYFEIPA